MEIDKVLSQIKKSRKRNLIPTKHFKVQCIERKLNLEKVKKIIQDNKILGILSQNQNKYKLWLSFEKDKDLHVIISISESGNLRLVTVFPCYTERRLK